MHTRANIHTYISDKKEHSHTYTHTHTETYCSWHKHAIVYGAKKEFFFAHFKSCSGFWTNFCSSTTFIKFIITNDKINQRPILSQRQTTYKTFLLIILETFNVSPWAFGKPHEFGKIDFSIVSIFLSCMEKAMLSCYFLSVSLTYLVIGRHVRLFT